MRVLLILVDGMRPDSLNGIQKAREIIKKSAFTMEAQTVKPSVTLPCHMSLFHSVEPSRHGTTTNIYMPQVRPINGLCEIIKNNKKCSAFFYDWEELRDLSRPGSLDFSYFYSSLNIGYGKADAIVTDAAVQYIPENYTDFTFLYFGAPDETGHKYGWMSEEYITSVSKSWDEIDKIINILPDDYTVIITADHGGHDRTHGYGLPEDVTIPLIIKGKDFKIGESLNNASIMDIAPTVAKLLDIPADTDWEGKSLL